MKSVLPVKFKLKKKVIGNEKCNTYIQSIPIKFGIYTGYFENI